MEDTASAPKKIETTTEAQCSHCGATCYSETIEEMFDSAGRIIERNRIVRGSFRQKLDVDGTPIGAVFPFCDCMK